MPPVQSQPAGRRGQKRTHLHLLLLFLSAAQTHAYIQIPHDYTYNKLKQAPEFTTQPVPHTAFSLDDVNLACEASGDPSPSFRWVKDGKQFGEVLSESGTLTPHPTMDLHFYQGTYRCYAANELGTAVSNLVHLTTEPVPSLAKVKKQKRRAYEVGESAVLRCNPPKSSVTPKIHWMDMQFHHIPLNERVTISRDGNLYFANLIANDSRDDYTCNAHYINASIILPKEPMSIYVTPSNSVVKNRRAKLHHPAGARSSYLVLRGQTLTLECIPEGLPTPEVHWDRIDSALSPNRTKKLYNNRWLQIDNVLESDDGEYVCTARNSENSVKHHYTVTVEAAPYWTRRPEEHLYAPGETVRLDCQADGIPAPNITWSINGVPVSGTDVDPRRRVSSGKLILSNVEFSDTAVYQCEAVNKHGSILINTHVHVVELPAQILTPDERLYQATAGQTVMLDCRTFGSPLPKIHWEILDSIPALSNAKISQMTNGSLKISNVSEEDSNRYTCSVSETNKSISAELEVLNRTKIVGPPQNLHVIRGSDAILHCKYTVDHNLKSPTVQWKKDGHKITASTSNDKYHEIEGSLKVLDVQMEDMGIYSCGVSTTLDSDTASGYITVQDKPDPPQSLKLSEKMERSVTISWMPSVENNSPVTEYVIEMNEGETPDEGQWQKYRSVSQDIRQLEIHLQPYSKYHFQIRAVNSIGTSAPSESSLSYSTPAAKPDRNPENVMTLSTDPKSMIISWQEMDRRQFNGPGFQYKVFWRRAADSGAHWTESSVSNPPLLVNNTGTFVSFEIKVQAVNDLGAAPEPLTVIGYSGEDFPLEAPSALSVTELQKTSVMVRWSPVRPESVRGHLLGYKIYLRMKGPSGRLRAGRSPAVGNPTVIEVPADAAEKIVSDLQYYSDYTLTITAFNSKGEGPHSEESSFSTPEGAPGPVLFLPFDSPSESEITLRWEAPHKPNGEIRGYLLQYQEVVIGSESPQHVESIDLPAVTEFTLKNLNPESRYTFHLSARNSAGDGAPAIQSGATLLDGEPPSVINMTAGETSVNLSWVPGDRHRNVGFSFRYLKKIEGAEWEESEKINSTQAFYQLQGLDSGVIYHLQVLSGNTSYDWDFKTIYSPEWHKSPRNFATEGWFIGLISALVLLLLVLLLLCYIKKSKGGKYSVKDKEEGQGDAANQKLKDDAFGEYRSLESDMEKCSISQPSGCESKRSSNDSLADYGDSVDIQFNEDGSFIGQYSGRRDPRGHDSSGAVSPVNPNMPPPSHSFPTSVTGILGPN
ncbi:neural cell adhesion molecule L1.1 precursor [Danio rerio]|uniref:Neural cell adhesion molecule L1 n=1 Tax=Danio rerio TaxID=7955 RepID=Q6U7I5_DANRE|nr:neural cell adhesion molecule L1.1 precursor [Danio rerio]AAQ85079.1 neural adhesion molecule L1.1 [Danio rerio]|eukprot:NP_571458.1 neural cell adhesion molecule L1.1 precursor [Danio rerio]